MAPRAQGELQLGGLPRPLVRLTPAKLTTWTGCRRRYRMAYLDRPALPRGGAWAHNTLGAVVHTALRALFDLTPELRGPHAAAALYLYQPTRDLNGQPGLLGHLADHRMLIGLAVLDPAPRH